MDLTSPKYFQSPPMFDSNGVNDDDTMLVLSGFVALQTFD